MRIRLIAPEGQSHEMILAEDVVRFGRDAQCEVHFDPNDYPKVSGYHASIEIRPEGAFLCPLSTKNITLLNGKSVSAPAVVVAGDRFRLGATGPTIEIIEFEPARAAPPLPARKPELLSLDPAPLPLSPSIDSNENESTIRADAADLSLLRGSEMAASYDIDSGITLIGREESRVKILLDHSHVSRVHARLISKGGRVLLEDLRSANGTFVNGRRIIKNMPLKEGDRIDIGPFTLAFEDGALVSQSRVNNIELVARAVSRVVQDRATGKPLSLLDDINLVIQPKEFVCLLGPSGSGKSTLLNILSGRRAPDDGVVTINNQNLYQHFDAIKQEIAVVPQKDILHDSLAVGSALRFTAELRLPSDTVPEEIDSAVMDILDVVNLTERRETLIRNLSGGQLKRASLANELMARPSLLFLDEVTSGLDEQTDREIMELFRRVADGGKTVVCITHNLANVEATCHLVVILTEGGCTAFVGTPEEAKEYFGIRRLGDVYLKLADQAREEWQEQFRLSKYYARYIADRIPRKAPGDESPSDQPSVNQRPKSNPLTQAKILIRRYMAIWRGDVPALLALLGQSVLVAFLLGMVFGELETRNLDEKWPRTRNLLFMLTVSSFWFGCNTAAKELVKERVIFARERGINLRIDSYLASKLAVLLLIGLAQVTVLFLIVRVWCGPPGSAFLQWLLIVFLMTAGTAMGLLLSALAKTEEVAAALVPIAIIPQIILAGVIAYPLIGLSQTMASIAITSNYGQKGMDTFLPAAVRDTFKSADGSIGGSLAMVSLHAAVFALATFLLLVYQTRTNRSG